MEHTYQLKNMHDLPPLCWGGLSAIGVMELDWKVTVSREPACPAALQILSKDVLVCHMHIFESCDVTVTCIVNFVSHIFYHLFYCPLHFPLLHYPSIICKYSHVGVPFFIPVILYTPTHP